MFLWYCVWMVTGSIAFLPKDTHVFVKIHFWRIKYQVLILVAESPETCQLWNKLILKAEIFCMIIPVYAICH